MAIMGYDPFRQLLQLQAAECRNGVLRVTLPKGAEIKPRFFVSV